MIDDRRDLIRLVTQRYREMQGLRLVLVGSVFVAYFGTYASTGAPAGFSGLACTIAAAIATIEVGRRWLDQYYQARFGRVVQAESQNPPFWWVPVALCSVMTAIAGQSLGAAILGAMAGVALGGLWIVIRDWPVRWYHILTSAAAVGAVWAVLTQPIDPHVTDALGLAVLGAVSIPTGLLDHRLLSSVMRPIEDTEAGLKSCATEETE